MLEQHYLRTDAQVTPRHGRRSAPDTRRSSWAAAAAVTLTGLVVYGADVGRPGVWMDEGATMAASRRSLGELVRLVEHVDLGHFLYYLLARTVWQLDPSVTALRCISVVAMSLAAGLLVLVGRRLGSLRIGVVTGLLLVASPQASRYAQEARSAALVVLLATALTWLLLGMLAEDGRRRRRNAVGYAVVLVVLGVLNVFGLLVLLPHAVTALVLGDRQAKRLWALAVVVGGVVQAPLVLAVLGQRGQVYWIPRPQFYELQGLVVVELGDTLLAPFVMTAAVLVLIVLGGRVMPQGPPRTALVLGVSLAVLPAAVLFAVSFIVPMYQIRYLVYTAPGVYLTIAALVERAMPALRGWRLSRVLVPASVVVLLALVGIGMQRTERGPLGHDESLGRVSDFLAANSRPGDALVLVPSELRIVGQSYPAAFSGLDDVAAVEAPVDAGTFDGTPVAPGDVTAALRPHARVWLVHGEYQDDDLLTPTEAETIRALRKGYHPTGGTTITDIAVTLWES